MKSFGATLSLADSPSSSGGPAGPLYAQERAVPVLYEAPGGAPVLYGPLTPQTPPRDVLDGAGAPCDGCASESVAPIAPAPMIVAAPSSSTSASSSSPVAAAFRSPFPWLIVAVIALLLFASSD